MNLTKIEKKFQKWSKKYWKKVWKCLQKMKKEGIGETNEQM
jgi:hypothetical protein